MFGLELVYQYGIRVTPKNMVSLRAPSGLLGFYRGHYMTPTQTSCTIIREIPQNDQQHLHQDSYPSPKRNGNVMTPIHTGSRENKKRNSYPGLLFDHTPES